LSNWSLADIRQSLLDPPENVFVFLRVVSDHRVVVQDSLSLQLNEFIYSTLDHDYNQFVVTVRVIVTDCGA
jgi:hypothetical protein